MLPAVAHPARPEFFSPSTRPSILPTTWAATLPRGPGDVPDTPCLAWAELRHADGITALALRLGLSRLQLLEQLTPEQALPLPAAALHELLWRAMQCGITVTARLHTQGAASPVTLDLQAVSVQRGWLTVASRDTRLAIDEETLGTPWALRVPTPAGLRHQVDVFDTRGTLLLSLCGQTPASGREPCAWRQLVGSLVQEAHPQQAPDRHAG